MSGSHLWSQRTCAPFHAGSGTRIVNDALRSLRHESHKSPSKNRRDRERHIKFGAEVSSLRKEYMRLFGHVKLKNGEIISIDDACTRLKAGLSENPNKKVLRFCRRIFWSGTSRKRTLMR